MSKYKTLDVDTILDTAATLAAFGQGITTLEIKNVLRKRGYWATQEQISQTLIAFHPAAGLDFHDNGTYRTYFLVDPQLPAAANPVPQLPDSGYPVPQNVADKLVEFVRRLAS